jgi:hypothetical protein
MHRKPVLQAGLVLFLLDILLFGILARPFPGLVSLLGYGDNLPVLLALVATGIIGFGLMAASTFLPEAETEESTLSQEILGREKLNHGAVYVEEDPMSVLDDEKKKEDHR